MMMEPQSIEEDNESVEAMRLPADSIQSVLRRRTVTPPAAVIPSETDDSHDQRQHEEWETLPQRQLFPAVHKRVRSWSSEGNALRKAHHYDYTSDYEDDEISLEDDLFHTLPLPPVHNPNRKITPAAMALAHNKKAAALQMKRQRPTKWLIPVNHPLKILWDVVTVLLSIYNVYLTHAAIRDRRFQSHPGILEVWFIVDILLNFCTQRQASNSGTVYTTWQAVWARYLTSWFVIDVLALFPAERLYIQPIIELQRKRKFWAKVFRRTKVATKVTTRVLQSGHVPWIVRALVKFTSRPLRELINLIRTCVKYIPKYIMFVRNTKGVILVRALRDFGHFRSAWRHTKDEVATVGTTDGEQSDDWEGLREEEDVEDDESDPF